MLFVQSASHSQVKQHGQGLADRDYGARFLAKTCVALAIVLSKTNPDLLFRILSKIKSGARRADLHTAVAARDAVVAVSLICAGEGCLPRSIATALFCRHRGQWPNWCVGARVDPFHAHAWVEVDGVAVGEFCPPDSLIKLIEIRANLDYLA